MKDFVFSIVTFFFRRSVNDLPQMLDESRENKDKRCPIDASSSDVRYYDTNYQDITI